MGGKGTNSGAKRLAFGEGAMGGWRFNCGGILTFPGKGVCCK
jgi:hypothetical protein